MKRKKTVFSIVVVCGAGFLLALPGLCSLPVGNRILLSICNRFITGSLEAGAMTFSWLGEQKIDALLYRNDAIGCTLRWKEAEVNTGLLRLLVRQGQFGTLRIIEPEVVITEKSLPESIQKPSVSSAGFFPDPGSIRGKIASFSGEIDITGGKTEIVFSNAPPLMFSNMEVRIISGGKLRPSFFKMKMYSSQDSVTGTLSAEASLDTSARLQISCKNLPLRGVDAVVGLLRPDYKGFFTALLGPALSLESDLDLSEEVCTLDVQAESSNLSTKLRVSSNDAEIQAEEQGSIRWIASSEILSRFLPDIPLLPSGTPLTVTVLPKKFRIPVQEGNRLWKEMSFTCFFTVGPYRLEKGMSAGLQGTVDSPSLSDSIRADIRWETGEKKNGSKISLLADCKTPLDKARAFVLDLEADNVPTACLNLENIVPSSVFGEVFRGSCKIRGTETLASLSFSLETPVLDLKTSTWEFSDGTLRLQAPCFVYYRWNPSAFPSFPLESPVDISCEITKVLLSDAPDLQATVSVPEVSLTDLPKLPPFTAALGVKTLSDIALRIQGSCFSLSSKWAKEKDGWILTAPLEGEVVPGNRLFSGKTYTFSCEEGTKIRLFSPSGSVSWKGSIAKSSFATKLSVPDLRCTIGNGITIGSKDWITNLSFSGENNRADCSFSANVLDKEGNSGSLSGKAVFEEVLSSDPFAKMTVQGNTSDFPITIPEELIQEAPPFSSFLGKTVSSSWDYGISEGEQSIRFTMQTPLLFAQGALLVGNEGIFFPKKSSPLSVRYTLTEEAYAVLQPKSAPFELTEPSVFTGNVVDLHIPFADLSRASFDLSLQNPNLFFRRKSSSKSLSLSGNRLAIRKHRDTQQVSIDFVSETKGAADEVGSLTIRADLSDYYNSQGEFTKEALTTNLLIEARTLPSSIPDILSLNDKETFPVFLGPSFNFRASATLQNGSGPLSFTLDSQNAAFRFSGNLSRGSMLSADKDITAELLVTKEIGRFFLQETKESTLRGLHGKTPVSLLIPYSGFCFPLDSKDLAKIRIPIARLDIGKIYCENKGILASALKQLRSSEPEGKEISFWFAPADFSVESGRLRLDRTEILVDASYDVAIWGNIDLPEQYVDMTLGLTASALKRAFGIKQLPSEYILTIPIKGPIDDVSVKGGSAASKITALLLWQSKAVDSLGGGIGGLLKQVIPPPGGGKAPPPKKPFPWETGR